MKGGDSTYLFLKKYIYIYIYIYTMERFLTSGSHILVLCSFQQFYQCLFSFQHSKKYNFSMLNIHFLNYVSFLLPMYGERSRDIQFLAGIPKFHNRTFHLFYSFLEQLQFVIFVVLHFQKGYYKTQSEELMLHVLQAACKAHCFLKSYLSRKLTICKKSMLLLVSCEFYCIYGM